MTYRVFLLTLEENRRVFKNRNKVYFFDPFEISRNNGYVYSKIPLDRKFNKETFRNSKAIKELKRRS